MNPSLGITMTVAAASARGEDGSLFSGQLSISEVPEGLAPAALPEALDPGLLITVQPVGVTFDPPAPITFPNLDNLPPGSETDLWSLDPDTGTFVVVGTGLVSANGSEIETTSGGIRAADWHFVLPPRPEPDGQNNNDNQDKCRCLTVESGSRTVVSTGNLTLEHELVSYNSLEVPRAPRLIYNSNLAHPQPILSSNTTVLARGAVPTTISSRLAVAGVDMGSEVFTDTSGLNGSVDETIRQAIQFDASSFETGLYPYRMALTNNYTVSSISSPLSGKVLVNNQQHSPLVAGWTLEELSRLRIQPDGAALITEGDGSARVFTPQFGSVGTEIYLEDFEGAVGSEWSNNSTDQTPLGARRFLGQLGNETTRLTLGGLSDHNCVKLTFDLFLINGWEGSMTPFGPHVWTLAVDGGPILLETTFANGVGVQAYPDMLGEGIHAAGTGAAEFARGRTSPRHRQHRQMRRTMCLPWSRRSFSF